MDTQLTIQVRVIARDAQAQLDKLELQLAALGKTAGATGAAVGAGGAQAAKGMESFFGRISQAEGVAGKLRATGGGIAGFFKNADRAVVATMGHVSTALTKLESSGKSLQWAGRQVEQNFTLPILAAGGVAVAFALRNETAFAKLQRVYTLTGAEAKNLKGDLDLLQRGFTALSDIYGVQVAEVTKVGVAWAQAGARGYDLAKATKTTLDVMSLSGLASDEAATSLIALRQQYGLTIDQLDKAVAVINQVANNTRVSFADLFQAVQNGGAIAKQAGIDIKHYTALVAAITPASGSAALAGNSLRTILTRLFAPSKAAAETLGLVGINVKDAAWQSQNGAQRIETLAQKFAGLSSAQKIFVANTIGTRFQVGRLDLLLSDINDKYGTYHKLLNITSDDNKNAAKKAKDVAEFLASQPQAFKIAVTEIENSAAKAIVPLLPALLGIAKGIAGLVHSFTELSPKTQEFLLWLLALVALAGPLARALGAMQVLFALIGDAATIAFDSVFNLIGGLLGLKAIEIEGKGGGIVKFFASIGAGARDALKWIGRMVLGLFGVSAEAAVAGTEAGLSYDAAMAAAMAAGSPEVDAAAVELGASASAAVEAGAIAASPAGWLAALVIGVAAALAAIVVAVVLWHKQIGAAFTAAWQDVISSGKDFFVWIGNGFVSVVEWIGRTITQLPRIVGQALLGVWRTVVELGKAIWHALQNALNPFQRHSPSLVDLVVSGVDIIAAKYASLSNMGGIFRKAVSDVSAFRSILMETEAANRAQTRADFAKNAMTAHVNVGSALNAYDTLSADLASVNRLYAQQEIIVDRLQAQVDTLNGRLDDENFKLQQLQGTLDSINKRLTAAKDALNTWANTPIAGMKAMQDAIFNNDIQTKKFQLQLMHLEDTFGTLDALHSRLGQIQGDMDLLTGQREALRLKGAGSDILGVFDSAINQVGSKRSGVQAQIDQMQKLQDQIDALTRKNQELQLQESITFDPQVKAINDVINAMKAMPFATIIANVKKYKGEVDVLTAAYDAQNAKVVAQQNIVDALTRKRDVLQHSYDIENKKLTALGDLYDLVKGQIDAMVSSLNAAAQAAKTTADAVKDAFNAAAAGDFPAAGGNLSGLTTPDNQAALDKYVKQLEDQARKAFGKFSIGDVLTAPFKAMWNGFTRWWGKSVLPWFEDPKHNPFELIWTGIKSAVHKLLTWLGGIAESILKAILKPFFKAAEMLVGHSIIPDLIDDIIKLFTGLPGRIIGVLLVPMGLVVGVFTRLGTNIISGLSGFADQLIAWASAAFSWLFKNLPKLFAQVTGWFAHLPRYLLDAIVHTYNFGSMLVKWVRDAATWLWRHLVSIFQNVTTWFKNLPSYLLNAITHTFNFGGMLIGWISSSANWLWSNLSKLFSKVTSWFKNLPNLLMGAIKGTFNFASMLGGWISSAASGAVLLFAKAFGGIKNAFIAPINWVIENVINKFSGAINSVLRFLHIDVKIPPVHDVATHHAGGVAGIPAAGRKKITDMKGNETLAMLLKGEGVLPLDTMRKLTPRAFRNLVTADDRAIAQLNVPTHHSGGIVGDVIGDIGSAIGGIKNWIVGELHKLISAAATPVVKGAEGIADKFLKPFGVPGAFAKGGVHTLGDGILSWLGGVDKAAGSRDAATSAAIGGASAPAVSPGTGTAVTRWAPVVMQAFKLMHHAPGPSDLNSVLDIIAFESGGNPNAINLWDSNAKKGTPSKGLMQVIQPTFDHYHVPGTSGNIFDPLANIGAGSSYAINRYGSLFNVPGEVARRHGGHYVGYDGGGLLPPGLSHVVNGTGNPEAVLTNRQWDVMSRLATTLERFVDRQGNAITTAPAANAKREVHFHGALNFPNVKNGGDAEDFIRNLESLT